MSFSILWAPDVYIAPTEFGNFSELDSSNYEISIGDDFSSGETISSSEMNSKFQILKDLFEKIINNNRGIINIPDNTTYINKTGNSPIVLFAPVTGGNGSLNGIMGANNKCSNETDTISQLNNNGKYCDSIEAVLATNNTSFEQLFSESDGPFYDPKGGLLSNTWSEFYNIDSLNKERFGLNVQAIWIGDTSNNCSNWNSNSGMLDGIYIQLDVSNPISSKEYGACTGYKTILCACK